MSADMATIINYVQAMMRDLDGVLEAPDEAPEQMVQFPFIVAFPRSGEISRESVQAMGLHTMYIEVHIGRQVLPSAIRMALPFGKSVPDALWADPKLGGNVSTIRAIRYTFGRLDWGQEQHVGWRFELDFKTMTNID
jgi:hypothetical protein